MMGLDKRISRTCRIARSMGLDVGYGIPTCVFRGHVVVFEGTLRQVEKYLLYWKKKGYGS